VVNALDDILSHQKSFLSIAFSTGKTMLGRLVQGKKEK
jgi:hypothetical protein